MYKRPLYFDQIRSRGLTSNIPDLNGLTSIKFQISHMVYLSYQMNE